MRRREVIGLFGSAAAWTAAARAQTVQKVPRIGILDLAPTNSEPGLRRGLRELGYIEGQNIIIEVRYADGRQERLPELAADLLRLKMDIIASATTQAIQAVRRADPAIPIVMTNISDPIGSGLADTLSHPGGNTTGVTMLSTEVAAKRLALLKEAFPALERVAVLAYGRIPPLRCCLGRARRRPKRWTWRFNCSRSTSTKSSKLSPRSCAETQARSLCSKPPPLILFVSGSRNLRSSIASRRCTRSVPSWRSAA
jgi:hypothetical protein